MYYRLSTVPIKVPSLKERSEDIYILFRKFCVDFAEQQRIQPIQIDERARLLMERYTWPGNIRELKNIAERLSVLSAERYITAENLIDQMPQLLERSLPSAKKDENDESNFGERDIMFKFLFDMKNDLNYLKSVIAELIKNNNLTAPHSFSVNNLGLPSPSTRNRDINTVSRPDFGHFEPSIARFSDNDEEFENAYPDPIIDTNTVITNRNQPIIIQNPKTMPYEQKSETIDGSYNLADKEKELIVLALKKHHGRRKEASEDLGISERTLYRKIKDYKLE